MENKLKIVFGKKLVKRDVKGRKMTQKGAIHAQNEAKQPNRSELTNHERIAIRRLARAEQIRKEAEEDAKYRRKIVK